MPANRKKDRQAFDHHSARTLDFGAMNATCPKGGRSARTVASAARAVAQDHVHDAGLVGEGGERLCRAEPFGQAPGAEPGLRARRDDRAAAAGQQDFAPVRERPGRQAVLQQGRRRDARRRGDDRIELPRHEFRDELDVGFGIGERALTRLAHMQRRADGERENEAGDQDREETPERRLQLGQGRTFEATGKAQLAPANEPSGQFFQRQRARDDAGRENARHEGPLETAPVDRMDVPHRSESRV